MPRPLQRPSLLITGATGMVGASVMARLLRSGQPCSVIARGKGKLDAESRIDQILARFEDAWGTSLPRPVLFQGDLNQPNLGLNEDDIDWIRHHCETILHSAASLSFSPASENKHNEPYRTNVGGTEHVLSIAEQAGLEHFHHISTAYTCGMQSGRVLESSIDVGQTFANDYENSKVQAELLVRRRWLAASSPKRSLTVYRPSIVIDPIGLTPVSGDRTIYGAFSMYQMLASRFGLPRKGEWFRNLGFRGDEQKNLVDVHWIAEAIETILGSPDHHGHTYHLTADGGTSIDQLDSTFRTATERYLADRKPARIQKRNAPAEGATVDQNEIDKIAAPFVNTFLPYFKDDPQFDRTNIDAVIAQTDLRPTPKIGQHELMRMVSNWSASSIGQRVSKPSEPKSTQSTSPRLNSQGDPNDVVLVSYEVRLPGGVDNASQFEQLLYRGESAIETLPPDRLDRELYLHPTPGTPGKTYTEIGGCVDPRPTDPSVESEIQELGEFDLTHRQFAHVAVAAVESSIGRGRLKSNTGIDLNRAGVFVGHSGGTELGGSLALASLAESATRFIDETAGENVDGTVTKHIRESVTESIRQSRPRRKPDGSPELNAYSAASLAARLLGFQGRREVIDAACSSSLIALHHAATAIHADRLDLAVVGGATYNNVDNLALFSQTGACSASGSYPFDSRASGLVSSEGYVAVLIARRSVAEAAGMSILATLHGVGISSDGKGKGLWAPRSEGQQLAMKRAVPGKDPLSIDYLECHATSTQVGDATELESLDTLLQANRTGKLPIGSVKSNLGHLLEAAGLVGVVKCLIAMKRGEIPPSINFREPSKSFDWDAGHVRVVDKTEAWPVISESEKKIAAVNAFGIGGLNAHAVIEQAGQQTSRIGSTSHPLSREPIAIVGRGLVLPGAGNVAQFAALLDSGESHLQQPPTDRWPSNGEGYIGLDASGGDYRAPHAMGGYIHGFRFDAQSYRIPPKVVANANPAQLMLIEAVRQAMEEFDGGAWSQDRQRVGVTIGTMFGGQFSNELQIGLRLPEICRYVVDEAIRCGIDEDSARAWADSYRKTVLKNYPALLDETGGFTASTLASRIARTFDLMGGACAVDADEASSGLAILTAAEQLASGQVDTVICGTAQRSMDLVALEQLHRNGRLARSTSPEELIADPSRVFPAEGVAVILLQRLTDAVKGNHPILGVIESPRESFSQQIVASRREYSTRSDREDRYSNRQLVSQIGHLGGGHGLIQTIAATIAADERQLESPVTVRETASDGYQVEYTVSHPNQNTNHKPLATPVIQSVKTPSSVLSICLQARSVSDLTKQLHDVANRGIEASEVYSSFEDGRGPFSAAIVALSGKELQSAATELLNGPIAQGKSGVATKHAAFVKLYDVNGSRIAWTFPGQGSQYSAVPRMFEMDDECQQSVERFDRQLDSMGLEPVSKRLHDPDRRLGKDVWWTQQWLLAVGTSLTEAMLARGLRPDVVMGHSFGECTAAWAAGVMTTPQAIEFAKSRSDAVTMHGGPRGELLSVRAEPSRVDSILRLSNNDCVITHHNSPVQTVIAGPPESVSAAKAMLSADGIASVVIPVPAAFHTPAMQQARDVLAARQSKARMRPPRFAFLSATQNRYLAEPSEIGDNLVNQLICPVGFSGAIDRLVSDGCGLLIEVGPSNVLTRLAVATVGSRALCLSSDDPNIPIECSHRLVELASSLFGGTTSSASNETHAVPTSAAEVTPARPATPTAAPTPAAANRFQVVDVTRRGRRPNNGSVPVSVPARKPDSSVALNQGDRVVRPPAPSTSAASAQAPSASAPAQPSVANDNRLELARSFLFDLVVDLTGYEPEIIDFEADLEAELGVDSIKKAQLIGELVQWGGLDVTTQDIKLAEYQSMSDILGLIPCDQANLSISASQTLPHSNPVPTFAEGENESLVDAQVDDHPEPVDPEALRRLMIDLLVDQTGYDEDIIDMDADLESELGVDSIKRAQLLGELEQQFELPPIQQTNLKLSDFPTLKSIHEFIMNQVDGRKKKSQLN